MDDHTDFVQEERLGLPYWTMILAICVVVDVSRCHDVLTSVFSIELVRLPLWLGYKADTASGACPAHPGSLAIITSTTFTAVIWDADEPCSVKTAHTPESFSTVSPRSTTQPLFQTGFQLRILEMTNVNACSENCSSLSVCLLNDLHLVPEFRQLPCWHFLELFTLFVHCLFRCRYFQCLRHWDGFVHKIEVT